jgi:multiple sugar transport system ATP-binding protein
MSDVRLENISKRFGDTLALDNVSLAIKDREFFVLLGPTGAGKTTTLRVIAGLEKQNEGHVYFDGQNVDSMQPADRDTAFVFQQYSLYPSMSVYDNLAFPLRSPLRRTPEPEIRKRVTEAAEKLRISHLLERKTAKLSGGEMQRVSIGRAIVRQPRIFLMDEPLSNLDAKLRESLRVELKHLQKTQGSTTLFVTHDQIEALTMADRIAVLDNGQIVQIGTPHDIYDRPGTTFVAQLVGTPRINLLEAQRDNGALKITGSTLNIPAPASANAPQELLVGVRPEDVKPGSGEYNGTIALTEPLGVETILHIRAGDQTLLSIVPGTSTFRVGEAVPFTLAKERLHYFSPEGIRI